MAAVNGSMEHKCEICEDLFTTKRKLKYHFVSVHDPKEKVYFCNICTKYFQIRNQLTFHMKTIHDSIKKYRCESCGKSFSAVRILNRHVNSSGTKKLQV